MASSDRPDKSKLIHPVYEKEKDCGRESRSIQVNRVRTEINTQKPATYSVIRWCLVCQWCAPRPFELPPLSRNENIGFTIQANHSIRERKRGVRMSVDV
jgi:hypothetical protein